MRTYKDKNTVINSAIRAVRPALHIPPHCNDAGLSLGCVEFLRRFYDQEEFDFIGFFKSFSAQYKGVVQPIGSI